LKIESTDDVEDFLIINIASAALGTALELGLFWLLTKEPSGVESVSQAYSIPFRRCRSWLELLTGLGLLEKQGEVYIPSAITHAAIINVYSPEIWAFLAQEAREQYVAVNNLTEQISLHDAFWGVKGQEPPNYVAKMKENPDKARNFTKMLYELHYPLAEKLVKTLNLDGVRRLMDLGGGSGVVSLALLRSHTNLKAVVVDIANVCRVGMEIAAKSNLAKRITFHPADFLKDPLPSGFDMVLECDVGIYTLELFRKLHASLNEEGSLVIVKGLTQPDLQSTLQWLSQVFISSFATSKFTYQTNEEIQKLLEQVGFHHISTEILDSKAMIIYAYK
jgi:predicted TPR repeat methyltransferase